MDNAHTYFFSNVSHLAVGTPSVLQPEVLASKIVSPARRFSLSPPQGEMLLELVLNLILGLLLDLVLDWTFFLGKMLTSVILSLIGGE